jgi:hypothetical protein
MARAKVNKAERIPKTFEMLGKDARPKDVVAALAKEKIRVSSAQVSTIKAKLGNGKLNKNGRAHAKDNGIVSLDEILAAKKLVGSVGSPEKAKAAVDALVKVLAD